MAAGVKRDRGAPSQPVYGALGRLHRFVARQGTRARLCRRLAL